MAAAPSRAASDGANRVSPHAPRVAPLVLMSGERLARVAEIQRARLISAAGQVACEQGAVDVTVTQVVERAGVSRRTFYEQFADAQECVHAALWEALDRAKQRVEPAWRSEGPWRARVRSALVELLCLFDEDPILARLLVVESLGAGSAVLEARARVIEGLIDAVQEGQANSSFPGSSAVGSSPTGSSQAGSSRAGSSRAGSSRADSSRARPSLGRLSAEGAIGGVLAVLHARISQPSSEPLTGLAGPLAAMLVLPYLGPAAARRELERPAPPLPVVSGCSQTPASPSRSDPFKYVGMRLTYRTMRVLGVIAEHPGRSNRQVGQQAEMTDQGQASKLLARLERLGLIANQGPGHSRGERNSWRLTESGWQVVNSIRAHAPVLQRDEGSGDEQAS